jgi:hypothetical protein
MLKPFFSYYGGKYRAASLYPQPVHDTIVEPFAGSAGYSTRHHEHKVLLYDKDPVIAGVWDYLIKVGVDEVLSLPDRIDVPLTDIDVPQEARWLMGFWINKGSSRPCVNMSKWAKSGWGEDSCNYWSPAVKNRIASQIVKIRHWEVRNQSYADIPDMTATWFVDPPYCGEAGKCYRHHDVDYAHLASWCTSRNGQTMVCEQAGAEWLPFTYLATIKGTAGKGRSKVSDEVVWLGGGQTAWE